LELVSLFSFNIIFSYHVIDFPTHIFFSNLFSFVTNLWTFSLSHTIANFWKKFCHKFKFFFDKKIQFSKKSLKKSLHISIHGPPRGSQKYIKDVKFSLSQNSRKKKTFVVA